MTSAAAGPTLDIGRPLRGVDDLERLVAYVYAANPRNETDHLEWKSGLDLTATDGQFNTARHILGFSNRNPDLARRHFGGLAYLVLGIEPGNAPGQPPMDPADVVAKLRNYLGTQGPAWTPTWVRFQGVEVLVITIEAPAWGDPIHTLRRHFDRAQEGTIFIRHPGRTDPAGSEDIRMLTERHARRQGFDLELLQDGGALCTLDLIPEAVDAWLADERIALMAPLQQAQMEAIVEYQTQRLQGALGGFLATHLGAVDAAMRSAEAVLGKRVEEDRSPEAYEAEVDAYLVSCRAVLPEVATQGFLEDSCSAFVLRVVNPSHRNLPAVKVEVVFGEDVTPVADDREPVALPTRPRLWGPRHEGGIHFPVDLARRPWDPLGGFRLPGLPGPTIDHEVSGRSIVYLVGHLRPEDRYVANPVPLLVTARAGEEVVATWSATSKEIDGIARGELCIRLSPPGPIDRYLPQHP